MGIQGLLPALKSITVSTHVKQYAQQTLGVDAYVWLHRGAFACAWELALGKHSTKYVDYAMHRVRMLKHYGVTPYIVFDGDFLPSKAQTEREREAKRKENRRLGKESMARGNTKLAQEYFQKAIDITPDMALRFILALQQESFDYVVAPYEADAQLAYLERVGIIDGVVTEDSDLLVFGCKKVLFKMNEFGECMEVSRSRFASNTGMNLNGFDDNMFRYMAILSGCDYLSSIPGMGLKNAHRIVRKHRHLEYIFRALRVEFGLKYPPEYETEFRRADLTFMHQWVFCPLTQGLVMGRAANGVLDEASSRLIGNHLPDDLARAVAKGLVDPITKEKIVLQPAECSGKRPSMKHSKSAPPLNNSLMDSFLQASRPRAILSEISPNAQVLADANLAAKRTAPRLSLREQAQLKKLKLFESSPSPESAKTSGRLCEQLVGSGGNQKNLISPFFAARTPRTPKKTSQADRDMEAALAASIQEERTRREFDGFQNPIAFEVQEFTCSTSPVKSLHEDDTVSAHFSKVTDSSETLGDSQSQMTDITDVRLVNLPTPPNSQDLGRIASGWKHRYAFPLTHVTKPMLPQRSNSISRMGGNALSRQSSLPNLLHSSQRRPFPIPSIHEPSDPSTNA